MSPPDPMKWAIGFVIVEILVMILVAIDAWLRPEAYYP